MCDDSGVPSRRCCACGSVKPLTEFYTKRSSPSGYTYECKECMKAACRRRRQKEVLTEEQRQSRIQYLREYREKNRDKYLASLERLKAKRRAAMPPPSPPPTERTCYVCGLTKALTEFYKNRSRASGLTEECKECMKEGNRRRRADPEKRVIDSVRAANYNQRPEIKARNAAWKREKRAASEAFRAAEAAAGYRRKFRIKANGGDFTAEEWLELCNQFDNKCLACGRGDVSLTVDHIVPITKGGKNDISNLQPLCRSCNSSKKTKTIDYRK